MSRCASFFVLLAAVVAIGSCSDSSGTTSQRDDCGDIKPAISPIINGVRYPELVTLSEAQIKAIGFLALDFAGGCSATAVAPTVVLAAAHCVEHVSAGGDVRFVVGENYMSPEHQFVAREWHMHPDYPGSSGGYGTPMYDVSVIILEEDVTAYGIEPIPVNFEHYVLAGNMVQAVGYGITNPSGGWNTIRWWTTLPCISEQSLWYTVDGGGVTGICQGDSGGPLLFDIPDRGVHVMGVVSSGEEGCVGTTYYPRTDAPTITEWLLEYISMGPCGWEDLTGRCDGDTAIWCEDDLVYTHNCAEFGYICGENDEGLMRCVEPPPPCGDETWAGRCNGDTAIWCEDDLVMYHACADFGYYCGTNADGLHRCVADPCRGETARGRCEDDTAVWCEGGDVLYHACADFGYVCGQDAEGNYRCVPPGPDECSLLGHAGECVAREGRDWARWCDHGAIRERDCTCDGGRSCVWTGDALGYYCR